MSSVDGAGSASLEGAGRSDGGASVTVRRLPHAIVITAIGEIDMTTGPALQEAVRASLAEHPSALVIDLDQARFFSSAGVAALVLAHRTARSALRLVARDPGVLRPLERTGLHADLAIFPTLEAALAG